MKTFSSLRNPVFRLYYGAMLAQRVAFNMQMLVRSYLMNASSRNADKQKILEPEFDRKGAHCQRDVYAGADHELVER